MKGLEKYYSGDENWNQFVSFHSFKLSNAEDEAYEELKELLNGQTDLAVVITSIFQDRRSINWVKSKPPILDGLSPIDCLNDNNLTKRLREVLMRMPV